MGGIRLKTVPEGVRVGDLPPTALTVGVGNISDKNKEGFASFPNCRFVSSRLIANDVPCRITLIRSVAQEITG